MKTRLNEILKGINLAHYDGLKSIVVRIDDLQLLRATVLDQQKALEKANKEIFLLRSTLMVKDISKPIKLEHFMEHA